MEQDKFTCYGGAKGQTDFDSMKTPTTPTLPSQAKKVQQQVDLSAVSDKVLKIIQWIKRPKTGNKKKPVTMPIIAISTIEPNSACLGGKGYTVK